MVFDFDPWIGDIVSIPCLQGLCKRDPGVEKRDPGVEFLVRVSRSGLGSGIRQQSDAVVAVHKIQVSSI